MSTTQETEFGDCRHAVAHLAAICLFALSPPCFAVIYKCTGADGKTTYGDTPCAQDEKSQEVAPAVAPRRDPAPVNIPHFPGTRAGAMAAFDDRRAREARAQVCTNRLFTDWQKGQGLTSPDPDGRMAKLSAIRNQCRRQSGLPDLTPAKLDAVTQCGNQGFAEYLQAHARALPSGEILMAKQTSIYDDCKARLSSPASADSAPIGSPKPIVQKVSAASEQPLKPVASKATGEPPATNRDPLAVLNALADRIYAIGETSGKGADMIAAEAGAADEVRRYLSSGSTGGLLANEKSQQSPLAAAAYMGYPNVVAALLTSNVVRAHVNDADDKGMTPWIAATLSMRQSITACNPSIWDDPFKFIPMLVTQPYYLSNPTRPYAKTRDLLEKAGAAADSSKAKEFWLTVCKNQSPETRSKVQASTDLQKTVQEVGVAALTAQILNLQKKAAEAQKK